MLNVAWITNRRNPRFPWFIQSLWNQWQEKRPPLKIIVVDFYADEIPGRKEEFAVLAGRFVASGVQFVHVAPIPNPWQGKHRLTKSNYFAAAYARNSAICLAEDGYIAFSDDLSVLLPGWLDQVREAADGGWIACGAYAKVTNLVVDSGVVKSFDGLPNGYEPSPGYFAQTIAHSTNRSGLDSRFTSAPSDGPPHHCNGNWMFGYSATPVEAFLSCNGYDSDACGLGFEDVLCGIMLQQHGYKFRYATKMFALESEEAHGEEPPFKRIIKGPPGPRDQSYRILNMVQSGQRHTAPNYFGPEGLRGLRQKVLAGEPFPIIQIPQNCWFDHQPLSDFD